MESRIPNTLPARLPASRLSKNNEQGARRLSYGDNPSSKSEYADLLRQRDAMQKLANDMEVLLSSVRSDKTTGSIENDGEQEESASKVQVTVNDVQDEKQREEFDHRDEDEDKYEEEEEEEADDLDTHDMSSNMESMRELALLPDEVLVNLPVDLKENIMEIRAHYDRLTAKQNELQSLQGELERLQQLRSEYASGNIDKATLERLGFGEDNGGDDVIVDDNEEVNDEEEVEDEEEDEDEDEEERGNREEDERDEESNNQPQKRDGDGDEDEDAEAVEETVEANAELIIQNHTEPAYCVAVSVDGKYGVSGAQDDTVVIFSLEDGSLEHKITAHNDSIIALQFSGNGEYLATGSLDGAVKVWSTKDWEQVLDLDAGDDLSCIDFHPSAPFLVAGCASGAAIMWHVPTGNASYFQAHFENITAIKWLPNGRSFATTGEDGLLVTWSPKTQQALSKTDAKSEHKFHECPIGAMACHPDNNVIATGGADGKMMFTNISSKGCGSVVITFGDHTDNVETIAFSNTTPTLLASGSLDGKIHVYNATTRHLQSTLTHDAGVVKIMFHPTKPILYSCSLDSTVRVWDARSGECLHVCTGHVSHVLDLALVDGGNKILTAGEDSDVMLFKVPSLE
eukprot:m.94000 g.94000  ORF g.94000 m.94000 type:complete len:627 (+) comp8921_c4_seq1:68-1948(+)